MLSARWKQAAARGSGETFGVPSDIQQTARDELTGRLKELLEQRRREPRDDLLTKLINSEIDGRRLTNTELLGICHLLFIAGLDTVTDSSPASTRSLDAIPCIAAVWSPSPTSSPGDRGNAPLRNASDNGVRTVTQDTQLGGCPVHRGDPVIPLLGSANSDERVIDHPML